MRGMKSFRIGIICHATPANPQKLSFLIKGLKSEFRQIPECDIFRIENDISTRIFQAPNEAEQGETMNVIRTDPAREAAATLSFRAPTADDGADVWRLIRDCGPLDDNSMYCNLLQCDHFADTCVIAEMGGEIVGWISAYIVPSDPETLFVWQVAVDARARGMGVAKRMLTSLTAREVCKDVTTLNTTITKDNEASWALFNAFADRMDAPLSAEPHFERDAHFDGRHATEYMVTIGAFGAAKGAAA